MKWTFQSLIDADMGITAHCVRCGHTVKLDLVKWRDTHGPDASAMAPDLSPMLRCPNCRGKTIGFSYTLQETSSSSGASKPAIVDGQTR